MPKLKIALILGLLLLALALRFFFFYQNQPKINDGEHVRFQTTLLKEPQIFNRYQRFSANLNPTQEVFITTPLFSRLHYGDTVVITGILKERVLSKNEAIMTMSYPKIKVVKDSRNLFLAISSFIRQKATSLFEKTLPSTSASLLLGIVFGIKESLTADFTESLRLSGVFHVVAASGMNVTMVGGFLSSIFGFFLKRQIAILASVIGIAFYAVLAGLDPPIVRASIMGTLVFTGQLIGRQTLGAYGLFLSGFAMLFFSPNLIFDVGFQLSFLATTGLLYIRPLFERNETIKDIFSRSIVGEGLVATVAAQAATLPVLLSNFGTYSFWSIMANVLVLWTIPTLMVVGGVAALVGIIFTEAGQVILYLSFPFLLYFEKTIMFFGNIGGIVAARELLWQFTIGYYCLLAASILYFSRKNNS